MSQFYPAILKRYSFFAFVLSTLFSLMPGTNTFGQVVFTYNSSGNFTVPAGVTSVTVECWGGGGAGGSRNQTGPAGGGGGGAYSTKVVTVVPGNTYSYTVGSGGIVNIDGGDTWFQSTATVMAKGGVNGTNNSTTAGTGGTAAASVGTTKYSGGNGRSGYTSTYYYSGGGGSSAGTGAAGTDGTNNVGAIAPGGGGNGGNGVYRYQAYGSDGSGPGGGGGGALRTSSTRYGGDGGVGQIRITYAPPYLAQFTAMNTGAIIWCAGETRTVPVTVKNIGTTAWTSGGSGVNMSYYWSNQGRDNNPRILPFANLLPGQQQTINLRKTTIPGFCLSQIYYLVNNKQ